MSDESDAAAQHEEGVDGADVDVLLRFLAKKIKGKLLVYLNNYF